MIKLEKGDFVKINYTGKVKETGEVFDTTREDVAKKEGIFSERIKYGPVLVIVGYERVVKGLDEELLKMKVGERKEVEIPPEKGFGKRDPNLIKLVPLSEFKKQKIEPRPGMNLTMGGLNCKVISVGSGRVRVDFNHPLAGKTLIYDVEVKEKIENDEEKVKALCEYYGLNVKGIEVKEKKVKIMLKNGVSERVKQLITNDIFDFMNFDSVEFSQIFERKK